MHTVAQQYSNQFETNPLDYDHADVVHDRLTLAEVSAKGGRILRLRMFFEGRIADLSYCHAVLPDGSIHTVETSGLNITSPWKIKSAVIEWSKSQGVYAKGLGLLDEFNVWSVLR